MTPSETYVSILADVEHFLQERAFRYFMARYHGYADEELLKVQCDVVALIIKLYLEPHVQWFEEYCERQRTDAPLLTIDLEPEMLTEEVAC